jgi:DNA-binding XRE family transcriptional regulator
MGGGRGNGRIERYFYIEVSYNICYCVCNSLAVYMSDISKKFGRKVKELRLKRNMSQGDLAKVLGLHPTYISGIERGVRNMALRNIEKLAKALGEEPYTLLK